MFPFACSVTVVVANFNSGGLLVETFESIGVFKSVRCVVVDGGSTDESLSVIKRYSEMIDEFVCEKDDGIYDAMNKGWVLADKESMVVFLGAGDRLLSLPSHKFINDNADSIIYGKVQCGTKVFVPRNDWRLRLGNTLHHQALLVPKSAHVNPPFDLRFPVYADYDFNLRLKRLGMNFVYSDDFFAYALPGGVSAKASYDEMSRVVSHNYGPIWGSLSRCYLKRQESRR